jgi:acyl carrier protein
MESEIVVFKRLQAIAKDIELTYKIEDEDLASNGPMNIDSLEFMSLLIEVQSRFGVKISDEEVQQKRLMVVANLAAYLCKCQPGIGEQQVSKEERYQRR